MVTELTVGSAKLVVSCDRSQWCDVMLEANGRHHLGSETRAVLVARLVRGLRDELPEPTAGELDGVAVSWVLSLSERHASVYAAQSADIRSLYFQDSEGKLIVRVDLERQDRERWISLLGGMIDEPGPEE